ncbi:flagellum-specific ATP synthase [Alkalihalophilus pseudofirmus OF4]|uniref:Flagellum-specific ATP synthase n=1 Tax=Alkalihalophilus pseudofirmus (strain ATCC BAA-2126 / JCM 17055 / OF4) TaxID=398511 RepID=D3FT37_ALKPO|nr:MULTISPECIES: flagellar protein export ATPase FliI [Alkalihalophilus]ADC48105.1 flagellum-specific ATP synthase [Alkalihalophilus pseudofirmus OF4]MED1602288.1 flagellar protein export ATPase FliI [Alkalihalophilus marmarensis]OLS37474.1 flagellar protein export ATPase FliI [Alkalihalophilus pseudofirmus]
MKAQSLISSVPSLQPYKWYGKVSRVVGLMIESIGPVASVGELCYILVGKQNQTRVRAEVVGFRDEYVLLMPLNGIQEIAPGSLVEATGSPLEIKVGSGLIGKVVDGCGELLDQQKLPKGLTSFPTDNEPPNPLKRPRIEHAMSLGVRAIDSLFTVGKGQRIGIFAGSGVGKSTLLAMLAKNSSADLNVIALIGERGREVKDFIERDLGAEGLSRTILVVATSDQPALMRIKGAMTATAIAEYFRNQGLDVNLMMDSVTRFAMAQREVGLATGEPPTTKGYTPSVFAMLPKLLERSGTDAKGSITAFYTVLVDGDDMNEPIADAVRGILDGHLVLDRKLANKGQFPAINVLKSVSRVMSDLVNPIHKQAAERVRKLIATYEEAEDLINIGAYKRGSSKEIDEAIQAYPAIIEFLTQATDERMSFEESASLLMKQFG